MNINAVNTIAQINATEGAKTGLGLFQTDQVENQSSFQDLLMSALEKASQDEKISEEYSVKLATGELENIHEATLAASKAQISLDFALQIRTKILDAYREITRMQI